MQAKRKKTCQTPGCTLPDFHIGCHSFELCQSTPSRTKCKAEVLVSSDLTTATPPNRTKICQTPGCTLPDFHIGCHSFELCQSTPSRTKCKVGTPVSFDPTTVFRDANTFQLALSFLKALLEEQFGLVVQLPADMHPSGAQAPFCVILEAPEEETRFLAVGRGVDGSAGDVVVPLTAADLARVGDGMQVSWKPPSQRLRSLHKKSLSTPQHFRAGKRIVLLVQTLLDVYDVTERDIFLSLDGDGSNREWHTKAGGGARFVNYDIDPEVALTQQLLYGRDDVIYTGAQAGDKFGYDSGKPPGIEYLCKFRTNSAGVENQLLTKQMCDATVALNLDFCGGFICGRQYEEGTRLLRDLLSRFPRLAALCVTLGKRGLPGLRYDFERYVPTPHGFRMVHQFDGPDDNRKVVSTVFVRHFSVPRTVSIPGDRWFYDGPKSFSSIARSRSYLCVVKDVNPQTGSYLIYCPDDDTDNIEFARLDAHALAVSDPCARGGASDRVDLLRLRAERDRAALRLGALDRDIEELDRRLLLPAPKRPLADSAAPTQPRAYKCGRCGLPKRGHVCKEI